MIVATKTDEVAAVSGGPTLSTVTDNAASECTSRFPMDALPTPIRQFVDECANSLPAPPELIAIPALISSAAAIGNTREIRIKEGWTEPCILYAATVSPSGTMKSPALHAASDPLQKLDSPTRRTWTSDITTEGLGELLSKNPQGLALIRDELSAWVRSMNQYRSGKGSDRQFYLSAWSGSAIKVDRKGIGTPTAIAIPQPCLSVVGCIPPEMLSEMEDEYGREDGFLARLLFSWPDLLSVRWTDQCVTTQTQAAYTGLITGLFQIPWQGQPVSLDFTDEARTLFIGWHDAHCSETEAPDLSPFLRASYSKLKGYCGRLALIHALATDPAAAKIEKESVAAACKLVAYFKVQATKVAPVVSNTTAIPPRIERCRAEIRRKLSACRYMKRRELQKGSAFKADVFNQAWERMKKPELTELQDGNFYLN